LPRTTPAQLQKRAVVVRGRRVVGAAEISELVGVDLACSIAVVCTLSYRFGTFLRCVDRILNRAGASEDAKPHLPGDARLAWPKEPLAGAH
jgi:hypothetical protein